MALQIQALSPTVRDERWVKRINSILISRHVNIISLDETLDNFVNTYVWKLRHMVKFECGTWNSNLESYLLSVPWTSRVYIILYAHEGI